MSIIEEKLKNVKVGSQVRSYHQNGTYIDGIVTQNDGIESLVAEIKKTAILRYSAIATVEYNTEEEALPAFVVGKCPQTPSQVHLFAPLTFISLRQQQYDGTSRPQSELVAVTEIHRLCKVGVFVVSYARVYPYLPAEARKLRYGYVYALPVGVERKIYRIIIPLLVLAGIHYADNVVVILQRDVPRPAVVEGYVVKPQRDRLGVLSDAPVLLSYRDQVLYQKRHFAVFAQP